MALKTTKITPTRKITVHTVSEALPRAHYQRCPQCDTLFMLPKMKSHQSAFCPRCDAKIRDGRDWSLTRLQVGSAPGAVDLLDLDIGSSTSWQTALAGVPPGTYFVRLIGVTGCGVTGPSNEVAVSVP